MEKTAKCPDCNKVYHWDWEQDCYCTDSGYSVEKSIVVNEDVELLINFCKCKKILGIMVIDQNRGAHVYDCPEWKGIDFDNC